MIALIQNISVIGGLELKFDASQKVKLTTYSYFSSIRLGTIELITPVVGNIRANIPANVVPDSTQEVHILMRRDFIEQHHISYIKSDEELEFFEANLPNREVISSS